MRRANGSSMPSSPSRRACLARSHSSKGSTRWRSDSTKERDGSMKRRMGRAMRRWRATCRTWATRTTSSDASTRHSTHSPKLTPSMRTCLGRATRIRPRFSRALGSCSSRSRNGPKRSHCSKRVSEYSKLQRSKSRSTSATYTPCGRRCVRVLHTARLHTHRARRFLSLRV